MLQASWGRSGKQLKQQQEQTSLNLAKISEVSPVTSPNLLVLHRQSLLLLQIQGANANGLSSTLHSTCFSHRAPPPTADSLLSPRVDRDVQAWFEVDEANIFCTLRLVPRVSSKRLVVSFEGCAVKCWLLTWFSESVPTYSCRQILNPSAQSIMRFCFHFLTHSCSWT